MTHRTVCNQTSFNLTRQVIRPANETQEGGFAVVANSPNSLHFETVPDDGTPIVYWSNEHRPCGTPQYNENPIP